VTVSVSGAAVTVPVTVAVVPARRAAAAYRQRDEHEADKGG